MLRAALGIVFPLVLLAPVASPAQTPPVSRPAVTPASAPARPPVGDPTSIDARLQRGAAMVQRAARAELDSAVLLLGALVADRPLGATHALLAQAYANRFAATRRAGDADSALAHAAATLRVEPRSAAAAFAQATVALARGDTATAVAEQQRALAWDPAHVGAARALVTHYTDAARYRDAFALGAHVERVQPRNLVARFRAGWAAGFAWDTARATGIYARLVADDPGGTYAAWAHGELAYLARARGDLAAAVRHMEQGRREKPDDPYLPVGHATMLLAAGDAARARPVLDSVLARDSAAVGFGALPAQLLLGWAARALADTAAARAAFAAAERQLAPRTARGDARAVWYLGALAALQGRATEAVDAAARAVTLGARPYGGPDAFAHEGWWGALRDDPAFRAAVARAVDRTEAARRANGLPAAR